MIDLFEIRSKLNDCRYPEKKYIRLLIKEVEMLRENYKNTKGKSNEYWEAYHAEGIEILRGEVRALEEINKELKKRMARVEMKYWEAIQY